jgi:hypothetical protein
MKALALIAFRVFILFSLFFSGAIISAGIGAELDEQKLIDELISKYEKEWSQLSESQKASALMIYKHGARDDLGWTAAAIAWQESQFGRWQINVNSIESWDCGMFQNNTKTVATRQDVPHSQFNRKEICTRLVTNFNFAYLNFAKEIEYWRGTHKDDWYKVWSSYNGGWKGNHEYARMILSRIKVLKRHL